MQWLRLRRILVLSPLVAAGLVLAHAATPADAVLEPYLRIQALLANDETTGVKDEADRVAEAAAALGSVGAPIAVGARQVSEATSLAAARLAFGTLSDAVIAWIEEAKVPTDGQVVTAFCPMVKKQWLQTGAVIRNPYFGRSMLGCGEIRTRDGR